MLEKWTRQVATLALRIARLLARKNEKLVHF